MRLSAVPRPTIALERTSRPASPDERTVVIECRSVRPAGRSWDLRRARPATRPSGGEALARSERRAVEIGEVVPVAFVLERLAKRLHLGDDPVDVVTQSREVLRTGLHGQLDGAGHRFVAPGVEQLEATAGVVEHGVHALGGRQLGLERLEHLGLRGSLGRRSARLGQELVELAPGRRRRRPGSGLVRGAGRDGQSASTPRRPRRAASPISPRWSRSGPGFIVCTASANRVRDASACWTNCRHGSLTANGSIRSPLPRSRDGERHTDAVGHSPASAPSGPNARIPAAAPTPVARMLLGAVSDRATGGE